MIKVSVLYPHADGKKFNWDYYLQNHWPLVKNLLGAACKEVTVDAGIAGGVPGSPPVYTAMGHMFFDSVESFIGAFAPNAEAIIGDVANFTDIQPQVQISEVKL
ncbi:MAG: EthD family reductase [Chitinophagaceae bacterium]|nr:EthD family reductase [Chitinophagaceae bacterium]MBL0336525.1 EthD family reductase [Chitinophagaceae bacterium]